MVTEITKELNNFKSNLMMTISGELDNIAEYPADNQLQLISRMSKTNQKEYRYQGNLNAAGEAFGNTAT